MSIIDDLRPKQPARVIDLVAASGHDVSDWKNFKGGLKREASNPKYCYEWAFTQPGKPVVLNLWHDDLKDVDGKVFQTLNYRIFAEKLSKTGAQGVWIKRSRTMDSAFNLAATHALPVRVIICDGARRDVSVDPEKSSTVSKRMLDPVPWGVTNYDAVSGECILTRGQAPLIIEDQFSSDSSEGQESSRRSRTSNPFFRDPQIRERARTRARGFCEYCSKPGFRMLSGATYIETHHIIPLAEQGTDHESNVIALCPDDHRRAHHGANATMLRSEFQRIVAAKLKLQK